MNLRLLNLFQPIYKTAEDSIGRGGSAVRYHASEFWRILRQPELPASSRTAPGLGTKLRSGEEAGALAGVKKR